MFKRYKKGIKVCSYNSGKFVSAFAIYASRSYRIGKWTERAKECGPLAVFNNIKNASAFFDELIIWSFFECKYKKSAEKRLYYKDEEEEMVFVRRVELPKGTRLADRVKLTKRINRYGRKI